MKISELERREFLANPELRLVDIPEEAVVLARRAGHDGQKVSHTEMAQAIKAAQKEYRAQRPRRRRTPRVPVEA